MFTSEAPDPPAFEDDRIQGVLQASLDHLIPASRPEADEFSGLLSVPPAHDDQNVHGHPNAWRERPSGPVHAKWSGGNKSKCSGAFKRLS